jgi:thioredoxin reductase (NADPH)
MGEPKVLREYGRLEFSGELNLLNSQGSLIDARTIGESRLIRIPRSGFRQLMRDEGDIANLITQALVWRRLGIIGETSGGIVVTGYADDAELMLIQRFLVRNSYPHQILEVTPKNIDGGARGRSDETLPTVKLTDGRLLCRPAISELADELGMTEMPDASTIYDVAVVGAGPAGLAAAVYAASEGLSTVVIEGIAPGGQAGTSSKIENYLGFPTGISGQGLATRAHVQALKFGVLFAISREVVSSIPFEGVHKLTLAGGISFCARAIVIASGAQYRRLSLPNYTQFENRGLYYAATAMESLLCHGNEVIVVGGGNSAGQAAMFLATIARHVHQIVRGPSLSATMSQYLTSRIECSPRITVHTDSEIESLEGDSSLKSVTWINHTTGDRTSRPICTVFVMIGAEPNSGWLFGNVRLNNKGFVVTGGSDGFESTPYATNVPGIFAVGDIRANSVKRVASAVGEGSVVISDVHRYLAAHRSNHPADPNSVLAAVQAAKQ